MKQGRVNSWLSSVVLATSLVLTLASAKPMLGTPASSSQSNLSPVELVQAVVDKEIAAVHDTSVKHSFRSRKQTPRGSQTKLYVETRDAMAGMVIAYNDQPITPEQMQAEEGRLEHFINNPEQLRHKQKQEKEDEERTLRIVRALPEAFIYEYAGTEGGTNDVGKAGGELVRLKFRPNPAYKAPTHIEQILTAMEGYVLIDAKCHRLAQIDGSLYKEAGFGWDIMGHLNKGGRFVVQQADIGDGTWEVSHMVLSFTGKILLLKTININSDEVFTNFHRVPDNTSFAQGVELLKTEKAKAEGAQRPQTETAQRYPARP